MNPSCGAILTKKRRGKITERKEGESKKASEKIVRLKNNGGYLLFALPAVVFIVIFCYVPMYGILIAFKDADWYPGNSILSNEIAWVGLDNFKTFFSDPVCIKLIRNTFLLCIFGFIVGFPLPIAIALLLNSLKSKRMSKALSTLFNAPHFISLVVIVGMLYSFFGESGLVNNIREAMGLERYGYFREPEAFRPMFILSSNWQDFGWGTIIYLAALSGVNPEMHEAAVIDGAKTIHLMFYITYPLIFPVIALVAIQSFFFAWNDFMGPHMYITDEDLFTLPGGIDARMEFGALSLRTSDARERLVAGWLSVPGRMPLANEATLSAELLRVPAGTDAAALARDEARAARALDLSSTGEDGRAQGAAETRGPSHIEVAFVDAAALGYAEADLVRLKEAGGVLPAEARTARLWVDAPAPGDIMCPLGMHGRSKKVSDILGEEQVPVAERLLGPVVRTAPGGAVVWLGGLRLDDRFKCTASTRVLIKLTLRVI